MRLRRTSRGHRRRWPPALVRVTVCLAALGCPLTAQAECWPTSGHAPLSSSTAAGWGSAGDPYEIFYGPAGEGLARDLHAAVASTGAWTSLSRHFGRPLQGASERYPIVVVPGSRIDPGIDGETVPLCGEQGTAILIPETLPPAAVRTTIVHELAHAFQYGVAGVDFGDPWWIEATATHAAFAIAGPLYLSEYEDAFLLRPDVPLDASPDAEPRLHAYGAFRFVDYLFRRVGEAESIPFARATFRGLAADPDATRVVRTELRRRGLDLNETLARFWARQVSAVDAQGPPAPADVVAVPAGRRVLALEARPLAAALRRLSPVAGVRKVVIDLPRDVAAPSRLLVVAGDDVLDLSQAGGSLELCLGPAPGGTYPWPSSGKVFLVAVNGLGGTASQPVRVEGSRSRCRPRSDARTLTCGPVPARFPNPRGRDETPEARADHEWHLFLTRQLRIAWDLGAALFDARADGGSRRVRYRRQAVLTRCAADRLRALTIPDLGDLRTWDGRPGRLSLGYTRDDLAASYDAIADGLLRGRRRVEAMRRVNGRLFDLEFMRTGAARRYDRAAGITGWGGHHSFWS